jgi:hypothetical protein
MIVSGRSRARIRIPPEWIIILVGALLAVGWWLTHEPFSLALQAESVVVARDEVSDTTSSVLVVLPQSPEAATLAELHWDRMWLNTLDQEVGGSRSVAAARLSRADMDPCEWVIVPRHATGQLDPTQIQYIRTWVEDGGIVLLEQPEGPWQTLTGQNLTGLRRSDTRRVTGFDGALVRGTRREDLITMPLASSLLPYNPADLARGRDYDVLMEIDSQPAIVRRNVGRGQVIVLLFDAGQAIGLMQQGLPAEDLTVNQADDVLLDESLSSVNMLMSNPALAGAAIPYADVLERNMLYLLDEHTPVGRLWLYPGRFRGAFIVSHSESGVGGLVGFQTAWEHEQQEQGTVFSVAGSLTPEELSRLGRLQSDLQFQWVPSSAIAPPFRRWGVGRFRPVRRAMTLVEQLEQLRGDVFPYEAPVVSRTRDGLWPRRWLDGFRALEAGGILMDSSLGPVPPSLSTADSSLGYMFGTGYPYRPLDANGGRFQLRELPTHVLDVAHGYSTAAVHRLIVDSSDRHHTAVVGDWRPDTMALRPSFDALEGWRTSFALARSQDLWVTTHASFLEFMERRSRATVRSRFSREERVLTIHAEVEGAPVPFQDDPTGLTPALSFPARFDGRAVTRALLDGVPLDLAQLPLSGDRILHLVALQPGQHHLQVYYATGVETELPDILPVELTE